MPVAEGGLRNVQVLDHEIGVDEIERVVLEGKRGAEVGDDEAVERGVVGTRSGVDVDADELGDAIPVAGEARRPAAACVEYPSSGAESPRKETRLDLRV